MADESGPDESSPGKPQEDDRSFECTIGYDADVPCVVMTWRGYATSREFRDTNERVLAIIEERGARKLLADVKKFVLIGSDDQHWLARNWIPRVVEAGVSAVGMVPPDAHFGRVAVDSVGHTLDPERMTLRLFAGRDAAREWLAAR